MTAVILQWHDISGKLLKLKEFYFPFNHVYQPIW